MKGMTACQFDLASLSGNDILIANRTLARHGCVNDVWDFLVCW